MKKKTKMKKKNADKYRIYKLNAKMINKIIIKRI